MERDAKHPGRPVATPVPELPAGYGELLAQLKSEVHAARLRATRVVNTALLELYWTIGKAILDRQTGQGWGSRVIDRLSDDLRSEFPGMRGLSRRNLHYMRSVAECWPDRVDFVQQAAAQIPWTHILVLLNRLQTRAERDWYAARAAENGWSRNVLEHQIAGGLRERLGAAPSNFAGQLAEQDSDLAQQLIKDPYVFEFLDLTERTHEREVEQALMDRLQETLLEFGRGFAFVGRQVHFDVDGDDFYADLLLFHTVQLRYVVVELKVGAFKPDYVGQLGFYVAVVDDKVRAKSIHAPTVGILLCASRNDAVVRYALASSTAPMAVANYTDQPDLAALHLPDSQELAALLHEPIKGRPGHSLAEALPDASAETGVP